MCLSTGTHWCRCCWRRRCRNPSGSRRRTWRWRAGSPWWTCPCSGWETCPQSETTNQRLVLLCANRSEARIYLGQSICLTVEQVVHLDVETPHTDLHLGVLLYGQSLLASLLQDCQLSLASDSGVGELSSVNNRISTNQRSVLLVSTNQRSVLLVSTNQNQVLLTCRQQDHKGRAPGQQPCHRSHTCQ